MKTIIKILGGAQSLGEITERIRLQDLNLEDGICINGEMVLFQPVYIPNLELAGMAGLDIGKAVKVDT